MCKFNPNDIVNHTRGSGEFSVTEEAIAEFLKDRDVGVPILTPNYIESCVVNEDYKVSDGTTFTVCTLRLRNGISVVGTSGKAVINGYSEELGRKYARENAVEKIWELEGYLLKQKLWEDTVKYNTPGNDGVFNEYGHYVAVPL